VTVEYNEETHEEETHEEEVEHDSSEEETQSDEVDEYTPNLTYKVHGTEKEFDDQFRDLVKDRETEQRLRELYEKSEGLDIYKSKVSKYEEESKSYREKLEEYERQGEELEWLRDNDPREYAKRLGIDYQQLALRDLDDEELPDEVRRERETVRQEQLKLRKEREDFQRERKSKEDESRELQRAMYLQAMERPEIKQLSDMMDDIPDQVIEYGRIRQAKGHRMTYADAVDGIVSRYKHLLDKAPSDTKKKTPKASIPKTGTPTSSSPEPTFTSLDELREIAKKRMAALG
jgi:hypothetical protein